MALVEDIAALPEGAEMAIGILHSYLHGDSEGTRERNPRLVAMGRDLLIRIDFSKKEEMRDFAVHEVISICLAGESGQSAAKIVCANLRSALESSNVWLHDLIYTVKALLKTQPFIALDTFLLPGLSYRSQQLFSKDFGFGSPIENVDHLTLQKWADLDPNMRYPAIGRSLRMFVQRNAEQSNELSPLFLSMLDQAPNKRLFLGEFWERLHPQGWSGSLADILIVRKAQITKLAEHGEKVRAWVVEVMPELDGAIERERRRDRQSEESFE
jgi:hypothetical protein